MNKILNYQLSIKNFFKPEVFLIMLLCAITSGFFFIQALKFQEEVSILRVDRVATLQDWLPDELIPKYVNYRDYNQLLGMSFLFPYEPSEHYEPIVNLLAQIHMRDPEFFPEGNDLIERFIQTGDMSALRTLLAISLRAENLDDVARIRIPDTSAIRTFLTEEALVDRHMAELKNIVSYLYQLLDNMWEGQDGYGSMVLASGIHTQLINMKRELYSFVTDPPAEALNTIMEEDSEIADTYLPSSAIHLYLATLDIVTSVANQMTQFIIPPERFMVADLSLALDSTAPHLVNARELEAYEFSVEDGIYTRSGDEFIPIDSARVYELLEDGTYNYVPSVSNYMGSLDDLYVQDANDNYIPYVAYTEAQNQFLNQSLNQGASEEDLVESLNPAAPQEEPRLQEPVDPNAPVNFDKLFD